MSKFFWRLLALIATLCLLAGCQPKPAEEAVTLFGELALSGDMATADVCGDLVKVDVIRPGMDAYSMDTVLYSLSTKAKLAQVTLPEDAWETGCLVDGFYTASLTSGQVTRYNTAGEVTSTRTLDATSLAFVQMSRSGRYILYGAGDTCRLLLLDTTDGSVRHMGGFSGYIRPAGVRDEVFYLDQAADGLLRVSPDAEYAECVMVDGRLHCYTPYWGVGRDESRFVAVSVERPTEALAVAGQAAEEELLTAPIPGFATVVAGEDEDILRLYLPKEKQVLSLTVKGAVQQVVNAEDGYLLLSRQRDGGAFQLEQVPKAAFASHPLEIWAITPPTTEQNGLVTTPILLDVPIIPQNPDYPTGCESVSAVMALQFAGESITVDEFIDNYLEKSNDFYLDGQVRHGPDPYEVFVGDPRTTTSYGCMAPVIEKAMRGYFGTDSRVQNTTGTLLPDLCEQYIADGRPVLVWVSIGMLEIIPTSEWILPNGELFTWPGNEHCMLLVGYDESHYYLNDPYTGRQVKYPRQLVEARYESMGHQSLVIL